MPVTKSAIKTLRKERRKEKINDSFREALAKSLKQAKKLKSTEIVKKAISLTDKAVKKKLIHKNKAARIKSGLSKLVTITNDKPKISKTSPKTRQKSKKTSK